MSLVIASRFNNGVTIAADSFVFDNNEFLPLKYLNFSRVYIPASNGCAITSIGSQWAFNKFIEWFQSVPANVYNDPKHCAARWAEICRDWALKREGDSSNGDNQTLRPISRSYLILCYRFDVNSIFLIDNSGNISTSSTYVVVGSGSVIVRDYLKTLDEPLSIHSSLPEALSCIESCFRIASSDLFVVGFPAVVVLTKDRILDYSDECARIWQECTNQYYEELKSIIISQDKKRANKACT